MRPLERARRNAACATLRARRRERGKAGKTAKNTGETLRL
jgi:hypothetical protein